MRPTHLALLLTVLGTPFAKGQTGYRDPAYIPRVDVAAGYNFVRSNAPPANCNCFGMNGAFASVGLAVLPWLSAAAEATGGHANNIGPLSQNLTLTTYTAGPRLVVRASRFRTFGQVLFGAAHGGNSYFPRGGTYSNSATSFAYSIGGGVDLHLSHGIDLRPVQVQYLHSSFPNGIDNVEHHLIFGTGIVLKFRGSLWTPDPGRGRERAYKAMRNADRAAMAVLAAPLTPAQFDDLTPATAKRFIAAAPGDPQLRQARLEIQQR